jgi:hypothetical protein
MESWMSHDVGLPVRDFLYTLDQLAYLLEVNEQYVKNNLIFFTGRSVGVPESRSLRMVRRGEL